MFFASALNRVNLAAVNATFSCVACRHNGPLGGGQTIKGHCHSKFLYAELVCMCLFLPWLVWLRVELTDTRRLLGACVGLRPNNLVLTRVGVMWSRCCGEPRPRACYVYAFQWFFFICWRWSHKSSASRFRGDRSSKLILDSLVRRINLAKRWVCGGLRASWKPKEAVWFEVRQASNIQVLSCNQNINVGSL